jgi:pimeloyl-ACP methyl ester carboxylesterase
MPNLSGRWLIDPRLVIFAVAIVVTFGAGGCSIRVATHQRAVPAEDGYPLSVYRLRNTGMLGASDRLPRAVVVYITGSEDTTVLSATPHLAGLSALGMSVYTSERRGVGPDGLVDPAAALAGCGKPTRVKDNRRVVEEAVAAAPPGTPVLLIGASEGGDVAAAVARESPAVTHLILMACGGGEAQIDSFRRTAMKDPARLGVASVADFDAAVDRIRREPQADTLWLGHPYRRWSTFAFDRVGDDIEALEIPVLFIHGGRDASVPVEDARALAESMQAAGKGNLTYREYPELDHQFEDASGHSGFPRIEIDTLRWLAETGLMSSAEADRAIRRVRKAHPELDWPGL